MDLISAIVIISVIVVSVILHEISHGFVAYRLGDPTAKLAGRLTLNPIPHIDPMGSVVLPAFLVISGAPILFGWAKPVPYNPYNLTKGGRYAEVLVAFAGPLTNFVLAIIGVVLISFLGTNGILGFILGYFIHINILLGIFNMIPIPPLDGSKVFSGLLPLRLKYLYLSFAQRLEYNPFLGFGAIILFVLLFGSHITAMVNFVEKFLFKIIS